jgi:hypothetical protein
VSEAYGERPAGEAETLAGASPTNSFLSPSPSSPLSLASSRLSDRKTGKVRTLSRQWQHMKGRGRYLDYMQYYNSETETEALNNCHTSWYRERQGEDVRYRACGCGRRFDCPLCGSYVQLQLAKDASNNMSLALTALDVGGVEYQHYGLKLVFTVPKDTSAWIDDLLWSDTKAWSKEVGGLFQEVSRFVKRWYGKDVGMLLGLDLTGESNPVAAHYHVNVYVFPVVYEDGRWSALGGWTENIADMRRDWTAVVNKRYSLQLANTDFRYGYLKTGGQMRHWHTYMYRPVQSDAWRGWQEYDGHSISYKYRKGRKVNEISISRDDMYKVFERVSLIPKHFKRLRWAGIFSDGQRGKTMEHILGLERVEVKKDEETSEAEGWERDSAVFKVVAYVPDGAIMRNTDNGAVFKLHDNFMDYRPDMVRTGRRVRWREPGSVHKLASIAIENTKRYMGLFNPGVLAGRNRN